MQTAEILVKPLVSVYTCHSSSRLPSTRTWVEVDTEKAEHTSKGVCLSHHGLTFLCITWKRLGFVVVV